MYFQRGINVYEAGARIRGRTSVGDHPFNDIASEKKFHNYGALKVGETFIFPTESQSAKKGNQISPK